MIITKALSAQFKSMLLFHVVLLIKHFVSKCVHIVKAPSKMFCNWYTGETNCGIPHIVDILLMNGYDI